MKNNTTAYFYLASAMLLVGTSVVVGKVMANTMPIFLSSFLSLLIASFLYLPTLIKGKVFNKLKKSDLFYLSLQALLGTVLYRIFLFLGLQYVDASFAGILTALQPAMITILAVIFLKEKQNPKQLIGITLAVIGLLITYSSNSLKIDLNSGLFIGTILILFSILGEACFSVFAKKLSTQIKPFVIAGIVTVLSMIMMIPLSIYDLVNSGTSSINISGFIAIAYYGIFLTYISFILWFRGLEKVKASIAGIFTALVPISGLIFSAIFLKDYPNILELTGATLIIISIILVVYKNGK